MDIDLIEPQSANIIIDGSVRKRSTIIDKKSSNLFNDLAGRSKDEVMRELGKAM